MPTMTQMTMESMAYDEVVHILDSEAVRHLARYGGDLDDIRSRAYLLYRKAVAGYDPNLGTIGPRIRQVIRWGLIDQFRQGRRQRLESFPDDLAVPAPLPCAGRLDAILAELSEPSREIVHLIIRPPFELQACIMLQPRQRNCEAILSGVQDYLRAEGWPSQTIQSCFAEIREVIQ